MLSKGKQIYQLYLTRTRFICVSMYLCTKVLIEHYFYSWSFEPRLGLALRRAKVEPLFLEY